jgi:hypothetical protein
MFRYLLLVGLITCAGCTINLPQGASTSVQIPGTVTRTPLLTTGFVVPPRQNYSQQFNAPGGGRVKGTFRTDYDIVASVMNQEAFNSLSTGGGRGQLFYVSGKVSGGEIDVTVPAGTHYLVFHNNYSLLTSKHMSAEIYLER